MSPDHRHKLKWFSKPGPASSGYRTSGSKETFLELCTALPLTQHYQMTGMRDLLHYGKGAAITLQKLTNLIFYCPDENPVGKSIVNAVVLTAYTVITCVCMCHRDM